VPLVLDQEEVADGQDEPGVVEVHQELGIQLRRNDVSEKLPSEERETFDQFASSGAADEVVARLHQ